MEGLGQKLKETRENMGLSLSDVEEATKIRKKYLQALENEDFEALPEKTYTRGFIKSYCKYLHLDPTEMLEEIDSHFSKTFYESDFSPAPDLSEATPTPTMKENRFFKFGIIVAAILLLFISSKLWSNTLGNNKSGPENNPNINSADNTPEKETDSKDTPKESEVPEQPPQQEEIQGVKLEIEITEQQCWVKVISDGRELFSGTLNQGDKRVFEGDSEIILTLGNAGAAKVTHNGEVLPPLGAFGEVVTPPPFLSQGQQSQT